MTVDVVDAGAVAGLHGWLRAREAEMLATLRRLVEHESPSDDSGRLESLAGVLAAEFEAAGAAVERVPLAGPVAAVRARFDGQGESGAGRPALVLCHFDTVWPAGTIDRRPFRVDAEGNAWGPGAYDMKSGIVMALFALRGLREQGLAPAHPVTVLLTPDEETGSIASRPAIEEEARRSGAVLVLESPLADGSLKTARKGVGMFVVEAHGRAAHAGVEPEKGASAIAEIAHQVLALQALSDYPRGVSVNVGVVSGGTRRNVVPAEARAEVDVRVVAMADARHVEGAIRGLKPRTPGVTLSVSGGMNRPPMERTEAVAGLFERACEVGRALGLDLREASTGGASDGNFTAALAVPTLDGLGARGDGAHAEHEHIVVASLPERAALLGGLLLSL